MSYLDGAEDVPAHCEQQRLLPRMRSLSKRPAPSGSDAFLLSLSKRATHERTHRAQSQYDHTWFGHGCQGAGRGGFGAAEVGAPEIVVFGVDHIVFVGVGREVAGLSKLVAPDGVISRVDGAITVEIAREAVGNKHQRGDAPGRHRVLQRV